MMGGCSHAEVTHTAGHPCHMGDKERCLGATCEPVPVPVHGTKHTWCGGKPKARQQACYTPHPPGTGVSGVTPLTRVAMPLSTYQASLRASQ